MNEFRLLSTDEKLIEIIRMLSETKGWTIYYEDDKTGKKEMPVVLDLDSAELPPKYGEVQVIAITRDPGRTGNDGRGYTAILKRPFRYLTFTTLLADAMENIGKRVCVDSKDGQNKIKYTEKTHRLSCGKKSVSVTQSEMAVLNVLSAANGGVVTYEQIQNAAGISDNNNIRVHICSLRKKTEEITGKSIIKSVRGVGYFIKL